RDPVEANDETSLCIGARSGSVGAAQLLLDAKAKPDKPNRWNDTPLMLAALQGNLDVVRALVAAKANVNPNGWTPLIYAATGGHDAVATFLLQRGAHIHGGWPNGTSAPLIATL